MKKIPIILFLILITPILSIAKEEKHKIEKEEDICISKCKYNYQIRECVYEAHLKWEKEISKYLKLLKNVTTKEKYKLILESQTDWEKTYKKDKKVVNELIFNYGGTLYYDIASVEAQQLAKNRAEFLSDLYYTLVEH